MINGVLVERTVKDVKPALQTNADGLKKVLEDLVKQYKTKQDDLEKWKVGLLGQMRPKRGPAIPRCADMWRQPESLKLWSNRKRTTSRSSSREAIQGRHTISGVTA